MSVKGTGPTNCDRGYMEYGKHVCHVRRRVRCWIPELEKNRSSDIGFMASVMALRVLVESAPHVASMLIPRGEVDTWQEAYLKWFERVKKRIPKDFDSEEIKERSLQEFERLRELGVNLPKDVWAGDVHRDLKAGASS